MFGKNPLEFSQDTFNKARIEEALRMAIIAELDAINFYIQLSEKIDDEKVKNVFIDIAREEKIHVGEFLTVLKMLDEEQAREIEKGMEEVREIFEKK